MIFLYMDGGPSQMDTFDPKPRLEKEHGQPIQIKTADPGFNNGATFWGRPWVQAVRAERHPVSDLFPHVASCVDDLAIVRSMVSELSEHTAANYPAHGSGLQGRPSMGGWVTYGLGSECQDLPGFIVLESGLIPPAGSTVQQRLSARDLSGVDVPKAQHPMADLRRAKTPPRRSRQARSAAIR